MNKEDIKHLLKLVKNNEIEVDEALEKLEDLPFKDLDFALIDNHRELRVGYPEVIYCQGKTVEQVRDIVRFMLTKNTNILGTRATEEMYMAVKEICPEARYNSIGKTITVELRKEEVTESYIAVVSAGTSDLYVVEEAVIAGMEGALASVIGGLVDKPVIAVPTSVGYGANFGGVAALLSMLNSCASGVSVVNIDNGFGAAYNASIINKL